MFKGSHNLTQPILVNFTHHFVLQISEVTKLLLMCIYTFGHLELQRIPSFLFSVILVLTCRVFQFPWCKHIYDSLFQMTSVVSVNADLGKDVHIFNMPANLENSAVATGREKVSFHSNHKERQCQRMLKLPHNCTHLTR